MAENKNAPESFSRFVAEQDVSRYVKLMPAVMAKAESDPDLFANVMSLVTSDEAARGLSAMASRVGVILNEMVPLNAEEAKAQGKKAPPEPWMALVMQMSVCMTTMNVLANILIQTSGEDPREGPPAIPMQIAQVMAARGTEAAMREILSGVKESIEAILKARNGGASA